MEGFFVAKCLHFINWIFFTFFSEKLCLILQLEIFVNYIAKSPNLW